MRAIKTSLLCKKVQLSSFAFSLVKKRDDLLT